MSSSHGIPLVPLLPEGWFEARKRYDITDCGHETPCWIWCLGKSGGGYGQVTIRTTEGFLGTRAHRLYFERAFGPITDPELELDHLCCQKACVNPAHLELVTNAENMRRSWRRPRKPHSDRRLTEDNVVEILRDREKTNREMAEKFGVNQALVWRIRTGRIYRDVFERVAA